MHMLLIEKNSEMTKTLNEREFKESWIQ